MVVQCNQSGGASEPTNAQNQSSFGAIAVAATAGLGQMVLNASSFLRTDVVVMGIVLIGLIAWLFDLGMRALERRLVPWKGKQ